MTTRYYEETPCEHGWLSSHDDHGGNNGIHHLTCSAAALGVDCSMPTHCPGGQRRELTGGEPDYERAKRQMLNYLDDELFLGLESELEGIVDWNWLVKAVGDAAIGDRILINPPTEEE